MHARMPHLSFQDGDTLHNTSTEHLLHILLYKSQQDAHVTEFILFDNCFTCLECHHHPSSGAHTTVTTAFGTYDTVTDRVKFTDKEYR
jgi:hypothetical protein